MTLSVERLETKQSKHLQDAHSKLEVLESNRNSLASLKERVCLAIKNGNYEELDSLRGEMEVFRSGHDDSEERLKIMARQMAETDAALMAICLIDNYVEEDEDDDLGADVEFDDGENNDDNELEEEEGYNEEEKQELSRIVNALKENLAELNRLQADEDIVPTADTININDNNIIDENNDNKSNNNNLMNNDLIMTLKENLKELRQMQAAEVVVTEAKAPTEVNDIARHLLSFDDDKPMKHSDTDNDDSSVDDLLKRLWENSVGVSGGSSGVVSDNSTIEAYLTSAEEDLRKRYAAVMSRMAAENEGNGGVGDEGIDCADGGSDEERTDPNGWKDSIIEAYDVISTTTATVEDSNMTIEQPKASSFSSSSSTSAICSRQTTSTSNSAVASGASATATFLSTQSLLSSLALVSDAEPPPPPTTTTTTTTTEALAQLHSAIYAAMLETRRLLELPVERLLQPLSRDISADDDDDKGGGGDGEGTLLAMVMEQARALIRAHRELMAVEGEDIRCEDENEEEDYDDDDHEEEGGGRKDTDEEQEKTLMLRLTAASANAGIGALAVAAEEGQYLGHEGSTISKPCGKGAEETMVGDDVATYVDVAGGARTKTVTTTASAVMTKSSSFVRGGCLGDQREFLKTFTKIDTAMEELKESFKYEPYYLLSILKGLKKCDTNDKRQRALLLLASN